MSVGRRSFLQAAAGFVGGAVGGTLFSPIPWKLADDSAIWTQSDKGIIGLDWTWRLSPEDGDITEVSSICQFCDGGCGIRAELVDNKRAIVIKGDPLNPVSRGGLCPLGAAGLQFLYAPYRISQPMRQTKERGDPTGFQPVSWDEALGELGSMLSALKGKPHSAACITGQTRSTMYDLWQQFFAGFGSANLFAMPSAADSQKLAASLMFGEEAPFAFAVEEASLVLSFGADLLEGWGAPVRMLGAYEKWQEKKPFTASMEFIQIEPRCSMTASKAGQWISIKPGTEAALALGMIHVLIRDQLYDSAFVDNYVFGFESWTDRDDWKGEKGQLRKGFKDYVLEAYPPPKVAEITSVPAEQIEKLARTFARHKKPIAVWGTSQGSNPENVHHEMAFIALNALVGNLRPNGLLNLVPEIPLGALPASSAMQPKEPRLDQAQFKDLLMPGNGLYLFLDTLRSEKSPYPIELLMVHEANPAYSLPENQFFTDAIKKIAKIVSFSSYMDETAQQADLILPNHCALERLDDVKGLPGVPYAYYAVSAPILNPQLDTKNTADVLLQVGKKLGGETAKALPWESYEACLQERVKGLVASGRGAVADKEGVEPWKLQPGQSVAPNYKDEKDLWAKLVQGQCWYDAPTHVLENIKTKSDRIEMAAQTLLKIVEPQQPDYLIPLCLRRTSGKIEMVPCEPPPSPKEPPSQEDLIFLPHFVPPAPTGEEKEYPLLIVGYKLIYLSDGYLANPPFMTKTLWKHLLQNNEQLVEIHPKTAENIKMLEGTVNEGDFVEIKTPAMKESVRARVHFSHKVPPQMVFVAQGLGHTAYDEYIQGKGINAFELMGVEIDPITGIASVRAPRGKVVVAKAKPVGQPKKEEHS